MRRYLSWSAVLLIAFGLSGGQSQAQLGSRPAPSVYFVLAGDRNDPKIGPGINGNIENILKFKGAVQRQTNFQVVEVDALDSNFSCSTIAKRVADLHPLADDVVIFYYSSHGFRSSQSTIVFPEFDCRKTEADPSIGLVSVVNMLKLKTPRPRLIIAVADTCNRQFDSGGRKGPPIVISALDLRAGLEHLLGDFSGIILSSGAEPGEDAYYDVASPTEGLFTARLMSAIYAESDTNEVASWDRIRADAVKPILGGPKPQHPQMTLDIRPRN